MNQPAKNSSFSIGPEDSDRACLLIHGFSGGPAEMRGLGEVLATQGIRVYGMQVAGHTGNPEDLISSSRKEWIASAEQGLTQLARHPRIFVCGLSMGGVLALLLASRHPERIQGVITMSTPTRFEGNWQTRVVPLARYFVKWFYPLQHLNFNDPAVQAEVLKQARQRDPQATIDFTDAQVVTYIKNLVRIPVPAIAELFALTAQVRRRLQKVRSPLLIIQSKKDQTVNPACAEELYRLTTKAVPKSLHWLEQSDHVVTMGPEREKVYRLVVSFLQSPSSALE